jgi:arsenite methyltransferase
MHETKLTSTGHALADTAWLDHHFEAARPEYEESLRYVGIRPGWSVLDAGCGGGNFLPLITELVGKRGAVFALDLASENIARVDSLVRDGTLPPVQTRVGNLTSLPFGDSTFDCVWSANVMQYLTESEFKQTTEEFMRVLKPGGTLAIKEVDLSLQQLLPMNLDVLIRFNSARRANAIEQGMIGAFSGSSIPSRFRRAGLSEIARKGWLVERWAPISSHYRSVVEHILPHYARIAAQLNLPADDLKVWREAAGNPDSLLDDPDCCLREFFVVTVGKVVA